MPDDEAPPSAPLLPRILKMARDPIWQAVGVVVAIVIALVPVVYTLGARADTPAARPTPSSGAPVPADTRSATASSPPVGGDTSVHGDVQGNCNGVGVGVTVNCNNGPPSMASILLDQPPVYDVWFDGTPAQLPTPPHYESLSYPCGDWKQWLRDTKGIFFTDLSVEVILQAGEPDLVTLTNARLTILGRTKQASDAGTWIKCDFGGGSNSPYTVTIDTLAQRTTLATYDVDNGSGSEKPMPPASITLADKGRTGASIEVKSVTGYRYEGYLTLTTSKNGAVDEIKVGSAEHPLRWIVPDGKQPGEAVVYGYDQQAKRWVANFYPFGN